MGEPYETRPGEITPQNQIEKNILYKENGAHFWTTKMKHFLITVKHLVTLL